MTWLRRRDTQHHPACRPDDVTIADRQMTTEMVFVDRNGTTIGRLRFRVCCACHAGRVLDIWVHDEWQRHGLGRELVQSLLLRFPGLSWNTTLQTRQGQLFFTAMAEDTSVPFPRGGPLCPHVAGRFTHAWRRAIRPVADLLR
ncbi:GNAT family N-acetyltransferase [Streptomyces sp. NPDC057403]|uniref:GNAT family N-acetyltransferase n=1 Tax=Streptomyces sp. NPDC057403 TaxID=3346119 RepID=UPI0036C69080